MRFRILICLTLLMSVASVSFTGLAQEREWWFDIEVVAYKRNLSADDISEQFDSGLNLIDSQNSIDIISDFVHPDLTFIRANLPVCFAEPIESDFPDFTYQYDDSLYSDIEYQTLIVEQPILEEITDETSQNDELDEQPIETLPPPSLFSSPLIVPEWTPPRILEDHTCAYEPQENRQPFIRKVPKTINGVEWRNYKQPYLLSKSSLELIDLAKDIGRKRSLTTLLHMGWRQQVFFGQDESAPLHLIAGRNYGDTFDLGGKPLIKPEPVIVQVPLASDDGAEFNDELGLLETVQSDSVDLIAKIQTALESNEGVVNLEELIYLAQQPPIIDSEPLDYPNLTAQQIEIKPELELPDIWELDGKLKIFLRYIGRTPYLHIDGKIDFRAPVLETSTFVQTQSEEVNEELKQRLQSFEFKQLRRVISKQLHYFDHPLFGLLVQIRRYDLPPPVEEVEVVE